MKNPSNTAFRYTLGPTWSPPRPERLRRAVQNKVVLITGASSGIGKATALLLGASGAHVVLVARRAERLDDVRGDIEAGGGTAEAQPADLADMEAVDRLVGKVLAGHEAVDVVISNAGKSIRRSLTDTTDRFHDVTRTNDVNYLGPVRLLMGLLPAMRERGRGHLVNVSTFGVDVPTANWSVYTASKAAFEAWLRCVAPEVRADGVATTSIHFPVVHTAMSAPVYSRVPGLTTRDAAGVIGRALITRRRVISPWWARMAGPVVDLAQAPYDTATAARLRAARRRG
ncbi:MAG: SDR family NAD(P)-dependent oxidoreductase [Propionibacteriales bacterium]|nr:SDR family NAD(P)-dependent oxidoreductase [Propionibacteriales bacterium]